MARNCWVSGIEFTDGFLYPIGSGSEAATLRSLYDEAPCGRANAKSVTFHKLGLGSTCWRLWLAEPTYWMMPQAIRAPPPPAGFG